MPGRPLRHPRGAASRSEGTVPRNLGWRIRQCPARPSGTPVSGCKPLHLGAAFAGQTCAQLHFIHSLAANTSCAGAPPYPRFRQAFPGSVFLFGTMTTLFLRELARVSKRDNPSKIALSAVVRGRSKVSYRRSELT